MQQNIFIFLFVLSSPFVLGLKMEEREQIADSHNYYRSNVRPEAADMLNMTYYEPAEKEAQLWASNCKKITFNMKDGKYGYCGQNNFVSRSQVPWKKVVKTWYSEASKFKYGMSHNKFAEIGHFTQVVWAQSHKVGCGYEKCKDAGGIFHNYVCNYCPAGNVPSKINTPYKKGARCSACPDSCLPNGLCIPK